MKHEDDDIPADMAGLPKLGQVTKPEPGLRRMRKTIESKKNGALAISGAKPHLLSGANKLVEQLTESVDNGSMTNRDSETRISPIKRETKEEDMAAKKKTAAKKPATAKKKEKADTITMSAKILWRMTSEFKEQLRKKAEKAGMSMQELARQAVEKF